MRLACWLVFPLPGLARLRDSLIRASFILTPDLQAKPFADHRRSLNHLRFFLRLFVITFFDATILFAQSLAGLAPSTALLPTVASFMQRVENGKRAHLGQAVRSFSASAHRNVVRDHVAVPSSWRKGLRRSSCTMRARSLRSYLRGWPLRGRSFRAARPRSLKQRISRETVFGAFQPATFAASVRVFPASTLSRATAR